MQTHQQPGVTFCSRCSNPLPRPGVACIRRGCRPAALRPVRLHPYETDPKIDVITTLVLSGMNKKQKLAEPIAPAGIATPSLEK